MTQDIGEHVARIGIIGSAGRMGQAIARVVEASAHELAGGVDQGEDPAALAAKCDVLIDFSSPKALTANLAAAHGAGIPIVIGTTGLEPEHHAMIDEAAKTTSVLQTGNTSLGVTLLAHLVREAAARLGDDWDIEVVEMHHRMKVDAPSGTALKMGEVIAEAQGTNLADRAVYERYGHTGERKEGSIGFATVRGGDVVGDHTVMFLGAGERVEIAHKSNSRAGYAQGSLRAVRFLAGQRAGMFDMFDVLNLK